MNNIEAYKRAIHYLEGISEYPQKVMHLAYVFAAQHPVDFVEAMEGQNLVFDSVDQHALDLYKNAARGKIDAIKYIREQKLLGLKAAKDYVDKLLETSKTDNGESS